MISGDINNMELSTRAWNCLASHGICLIEEIDATTDKELLSFKNLGKVTLEEIRTSSKQYKEYQEILKTETKAFKKKWGLK